MNKVGWNARRHGVRVRTRSVKPPIHHTTHLQVRDSAGRMHSAKVRNHSVNTYLEIIEEHILLQAEDVFDRQLVVIDKIPEHTVRAAHL